METNRPILSIIVPTKDRYKYLPECIESLIATKKEVGDDLDIVIQDNTEDNHEILPIVHEYETHIKYFHVRESLSVVENSDRAILNTSGEYVCFIGDDDSVLPNIVEVARWMKSNKIEACVGTIARFNWPDLISHYHKIHSIAIPKEKGINKLKEPQKIADKVLEMGGTSMLDLPKVYHGIVSRKALDRVYKNTGSFFPGPSPDMANAIALAYTVKNFALIDMPFILSGFSFKSTGGQGARHAHIGRLEDMPFLPKDTIANWDKGLPKIWTAQTIWAQSVLESLRKMKLIEKCNKFNYNAFYGTFLTYNWNMRRCIYPFLKIGRTPSVISSIVRNINNRGAYFIKNMLVGRVNSLSRIYTIDNIRSLHQGVIATGEYIKSKAFNLPNV